MVNTDQGSRQQIEKATNPHATDHNKRESWPTGPDGCVKQTWDADVLRPLGNWLPLFKSVPCPLTVALSLLTPLPRTHRNLTEIVDALLPMFVGQDRLEHVSIKRMRLPRIAGGFDVTSTLLRSPMAFLAQHVTVAPSVAKSIGLQAIKSLGLVEAARDAQEQLKRMELTMDDTAMPRGTDAPGWELVARVGARPLGRRKTRWKQPLAEAAIRCEPLRSLVVRLTRMGGDENALWLTANEGPECAPLEEMEFRINARVRLDLPVIQQVSCQHQRRQKPDGTAGARCLAHLDEQGQHAQKCLIGGDPAKLHDVGCRIIHNACCEAGLKSQREVIVPTHWRQRSSLNHGLTWTHGSTRGCRTPDPTPESSTRKLFTTLQRTRRGTGCGASGASENEQVRESEGRSWSHWHLLAAQRTIWPRVVHALSQACGVQTSNQQSSRQRWRTTTARDLKTLSIALARYTAATVLSATGHKALRGTWCALALFSSFVPFGTEPLLVNAESKTQIERGALLSFLLPFGTEPLLVGTTSETETETHTDTGTDTNTPQAHLHLQRA